MERVDPEVNHCNIFLTLSLCDPYLAIQGIKNVSRWEIVVTFLIYHGCGGRGSFFVEAKDRLTRDLSVSQGGEDITHLHFVDDTILFSLKKWEEAAALNLTF